MIARARRLWRKLRGEPPDVTRARQAAERAERRYARVMQDQPVIDAESSRIRRISAHNNLAPIILRAIGPRE